MNLITDLDSIDDLQLRKSLIGHTQTVIHYPDEKTRNIIKSYGYIHRHNDKLTHTEIAAPGTGNTVWTTDHKGRLQLTKV